MPPAMLQLTLDLGAPAVFNSSASGAWLVESDGLIPGAAIAGAAAARWRAVHRVGSFAEARANAEYRRLFMSGEVAFLNGYLRVAGVRALPVPLSLHRRREDDAIVDLAVFDPGVEVRALGRGPQAVVADTTIELAEPRRTLRYHTARSRIAGRATESEGALFSYEALDAGQSFGALVVGERDDLLELRELLEGSRLALGRSRSAGYGAQARVAAGSVEVLAPEHARHGGTSSDGDLTLTLTAPLLARDRESGSHGGFPYDELAERLAVLGTNLSPRELVERSRGLTFSRLIVVGGFSRAWNLRSGQWRALAPGSVLRFRDLRLSEELRLRLQTSGLGEQRAVGFGRFVLNWHGEHGQLTEVDVRDVSSSVAGDAPALYRRIVEDAHRTAAETVVRRAARDRMVRTPPSKHQAARFASIIRAMPLTQQGRDSALAALDGLRGDAKKSLDGCTVADMPLREYLRRWLQTPERELATLGDAHALADELRRIKATVSLEQELALARAHLVELLTAIRKQQVERS